MSLTHLKVVISVYHKNELAVVVGLPIFNDCDEINELNIMLEKIKNVYYPVMVASIVAIGGFLLGFDGVVNSGAIPFYKYTFGISDQPLLIGISSSMIILGAFVGNLSAGTISDKFGRKPSLMLTSILFSVGALGTAMATNIFLFIFCKLIAGLGVGIAILVAPMYISEIAPPKQRGWLVTFNQLNIVLGLSIAYFSNYYILQMVEDPNLNWRWMLGVGAIPALLYTLLLLIIPESPRWLLQHHKETEALKVLKKVGGESYAQEELQTINTSLSKQSKNTNQKDLRGELFQKKMRLVLFIGLGLAIFQQTSGINAILYYAPMIFEMTGEGQDSAFMQSIIIGIVFVVMTVISMLLIDRLGRRPLLIMGTTIMTFSLFFTAYYFYDATYSITKEKIAGISNSLERNILLEEFKRMDVELLPFDEYKIMGDKLQLLKNGTITQSVSGVNEKIFAELTQISMFTSSLNKAVGYTFESELDLYGEVKSDLFLQLFPNEHAISPQTERDPFFLAAKNDLLKGSDYKKAFRKSINATFSSQYQSILLNNSIHINSFFVLFGILGFIAGFSISVGPVMWAMLPEILPNHLRGIGISIIGGVNSATSFLVATVFPLELELLGAGTTFVIFGVCMLLCFAFSVFVVRETKGKSLEQIEEELIGEKISDATDAGDVVAPLAH
ncbi:sugar porter family MFS transporter [Flammeovirga aprica]|uniref:Sugar porter family MFS transporter n=1 Tax=Flammeovirga aprica JL-4 TaxID=694437 RepID=A0A7X9RXY1_9BACT|nr:sugar porter family MFS transporter [Flammeovirga aprica]NME70644.1 sugar porter family MFS transporter [Flammeovirga aprica JL-4]